MTTLDTIHRSTTLDQLQALVANIVRQAPQLEARAEKAAMILLAGKVASIGHDLYEVVNGDGSGCYIVDQAAERCQCADFQHRAPVVKDSRLCKHRLAALFFQELGRRTPPTPTRVARLAPFRRGLTRHQLRKVAA